MSPYFIMHTGKGLTLVNAEKGKTYDLAFNNQTNFNVCRSIQIVEIEKDNPEQGFWLAQIDNGKTLELEIKAFDFKEDFMNGLRILGERALKEFE